MIDWAKSTKIRKIHVVNESMKLIKTGINFMKIYVRSIINVYKNIHDIMKNTSKIRAKS